MVLLHKYLPRGVVQFTLKSVEAKDAKNSEESNFIPPFIALARKVVLKSIENGTTPEDCGELQFALLLSNAFVHILLPEFD